MSEIWAKWEGQIINGVFFRCAAFWAAQITAEYSLTESKARNLPNAALKLIPAIPALAEAQLSHWTAAAALSHPHLLRLLEAGRCHLGGLQFLFRRDGIRRTDSLANSAPTRPDGPTK